MGYVVLVKTQYGELKQKDCANLDAAAKEILEATQRGETPQLLQELSFKVNISIEGGEPIEVTQTKAESNQDPGAESESEVRGGDTSAIQKLD